MSARILLWAAALLPVPVAVAAPGPGSARQENGAPVQDRLAELQAAIAEFRQRVTAAPPAVRTEAARKPARWEPPAQERVDVMELETLEDRAAQARAALESHRAQSTRLNQDIAEATTRTGELPQAIAKASVAADAAEAAAAAAEPGAAEEATRAAKVARAEAELLQAERAAIEAESELLRLQLEHARTEVTAAEAAVTFWNQQVQERQELEGLRDLRIRRRQLEAAIERFPALAGLEEPELALRAELVGEDGLTARIAEARRETRRLEERAKAVAERRVRADKRVRLGGGLSTGMGAALQRDLETLEKPRTLAAEERARVEVGSMLEFRSIELDEAREELRDLDAAAEKAVDEALEERPEAERTPAMVEAAREILAARLEAINEFDRRLQTLKDEYLNQRTEAALLRTRVEAFRARIEGLVLFVQSAEPIGLGTFTALPGDALELAAALTPDPTDGRLASLLGRTVEDRPKGVEPTPTSTVLRGVGLVLAFALLLLVRRRIVGMRERMGQLVRSFRTDRFVFTARAVVQTLLIAAPWPFALWVVSCAFPEPALVLFPGAKDGLMVAIGSGLADMAAVWLVLGFVRGVTADQGLGTAHFRWSPQGMDFLRRELRWFTPAIVPLGAAALILTRQPDGDWQRSLGRLTFSAAMLVMASFSHRILRSDSPLWKLTKKPAGGDRGLLQRTRKLWSFIATALPLLMLVLTLTGYDYTAHRFEERLRLSWLFALSLALVNALLLRWLFIARRRLAVAQALEAKARREEEDDAEEGAAVDAPVPLDADKVDIPAVDAQTRQLFKSSITLASLVGIYLIWASVLPALQAFDRIQLLPRPEILDAVVLDGGGPGSAGESASTAAAATPDGATGPNLLPSSAVTAPANEVIPEGIPTQLTLADVLLAAVFVMLTSVAARNLPALLELTILQRLPIDGGARYAISTIVRYVILIFGVSLVSSALGIGWAKIQWIAAALTFGLAFGLQEIFANFVSGLIILIERPIRVGDIVTVGGIEGRVTQLRMRATTILDWDMREMLVPNKEFITNAVINWTLSDPTTRIVIPVGIAYGSDTRKARGILMRVAKDHRLVVDDPAPSAIFRRFGDSTLDFELRVFIENRNLWPTLIDELHSAIDDAFRRADIEIAFPQRDIHVRTWNVPTGGGPGSSGSGPKD